MAARLAGFFLLALPALASAQAVLPPSSGFGPQNTEWMNNIGKHKFEPGKFEQPVIKVSKNAENGMYIWIAASVAAGIALLGGVAIRFLSRTNRSNPSQDPWIKAKLNGGPAPGTLTPMDPIPIPVESAVARAMPKPTLLDLPPVDDKGFTFNYARKMRGL